MAGYLTLLGALVATQNLTVDDAVILADYCDHADESGFKPKTVMSAVDNALAFFRPPPDDDAAEEVERVRAAHNASTCPDCGGEMMDEVDVDMAFDLWRSVRMVVDKYEYDMFHESDGREEC